MAPAKDAPAVDELGSGHLAQKAAARATVLPGEVRKHVRRAHGDAQRRVERTEALFEKDVEDSGAENPTHGSAFDHEGHAPRRG